MLRCFWLLNHYLVVKDYELPKSTSHILSVALTLERYLDPPYFFCLNSLPDDVLCKNAI